MSMGPFTYTPKAEYPPGTRLKASFYGREVEITNVGRRWDVRWETPPISRLVQDEDTYTADESGDLSIPSTLGLFKGIWKDVGESYEIGPDEFPTVTLTEGTLNEYDEPEASAGGRIILTLPDDLPSGREVFGYVALHMPVSVSSVDVRTTSEYDGSVSRFHDVTEVDLSDEDGPYIITVVPFHMTPRMLGLNLVLDVYVPEGTPLHFVDVSISSEQYKPGDYVIHDNALWVLTTIYAGSIEPGGVYDTGEWLQVLKGA